MSDRQVTIKIRGRLVYVEPTVGDALAPLTEYTVNGFEPGGPYGYRATTVKRSLAEIDSNGWLILPIHLVYQAFQLLQEAQSKVRVIFIMDEGGGTTVYAEELARASATDHALLAAIAKTPTGLIEFSREAQQLDVIELLCRVHHQARIYIAVSTTKHIQQLNLALEERLGTAVGIAGSRQTGDALRIVVGTIQEATQDIHQQRGYARVDDGTDGHEDQRGRDLLLIADAASVATDRQAVLMLRSSAPRAYAFVRAGQQLDTHRRALLNLLFGRTLWREPGQHGARAAVRVQFLQPQLGHLPHVRRHDALDLKRKTDWDNKSRNDFIASVAAALASQNADRLGELGLFLDAEVLARRPSVSILVESAEHGRELHQRLAGWEFWHKVPHSGPEQPIEPFKEKLFDKVIMTLPSARSQPEINTDVLIRADGTEWPLNLNFPPPAAGPDSAVLLIDLADDVNRLARAATRSRLRRYRRTGWQIGSLPAWLQTPTEDTRRR